MGTPAFAVPVLQTLIESRHEVAAVYTQPDKVQGRGRKLVFSPVKELAVSQGIPVIQPEKLGKRAVLEEMRSFQADVIVVAAFGKILRTSVLEMTPYGCLNVHASLLPKYRGAAPVQWAILDGEEKTGVTIMQMNEGLDTGDMLACREIPILPEDTGDSLEEKLSRLGGPLLLEVLTQLENGTAHPVKQPEESPSVYAKMLDKQMGLLDFSETTRKILLKIRALNSWPSAYTYLDGRMLKIWAAEGAETGSPAEPGTVTDVTKHSFLVKTGDGAVRILELQPEGKKRMDTDAFMRGTRITEGMRFTAPDPDPDE